MSKYLAVLILIFLLLSCGSNPLPPQRPNILFIAVDDLRPELGAYGKKYVHSPNIDRLAQGGITFNRAYVQQAVCNPSRASLLTGLRPDALKVWDLRTDFRSTRPEVVTLPQYFKQQGYHSVAIGKIYHNILPDTLSWSEPKIYVPGFPFDPDAVYCTPENLAIQEGRKQQAIAAGREKQRIDQFGHWYLKASSAEAPDVADNKYYDGAQTDAAVKKLAELQQRDKPFFFAVGYYRPHLPFNAPKKYWDLYDRAAIPAAETPQVPQDGPEMAINNMRELRGYSDFKGVSHPFAGSISADEAKMLKHGYLASVSYVDAQIGRLLQTLDELGLSDNTIVVLWGDHGWKLGEHNSWGKMTNYEIDAHAPLIIRAPYTGQQNVRVNGMVEFVDVYPTLCDLAGLAIPESLQGKSALPLIKNPLLPGKPAVYTQFLREGIWLAPDGVEYMGYSVRSERYRYVKWINQENHTLAAQELYDHQSDPGESVNLAANPESAALMEELEQQMAAMGWQD